MWRARVPPPASSTTWMPSFRAATISSRIGNTAARPRSRMLWPPILTTLTSGITAVGLYSKLSCEPVNDEPESDDSIVRRSATGGLLDDHGADVFAGECARELPRHEAVDDHDALEVLRGLPGVEQLLV